MRILAIAGSLRADSHNREPAGERGRSTLAARGAEVEILGSEALRALPHFEEDLEASARAGRAAPRACRRGRRPADRDPRYKARSPARSTTPSTGPPARGPTARSRTSRSPWSAPAHDVRRRLGPGGAAQGARSAGARVVDAELRVGNARTPSTPRAACSRPSAGAMTPSRPLPTRSSRRSPGGRSALRPRSSRPPLDRSAPRGAPPPAGARPRAIVRAAAPGWVPASVWVRLDRTMDFRSPTGTASPASPPARCAPSSPTPRPTPRPSWRGPRVRRRGRRGRGLPRADAHRLLDRGPAAAGHAARRGRGRAGRGRRGVGGPAAGARRRRARCGRNRIHNCAVGRPPRAAARRRARSRTCRPTASSTSGASSRRATTCAARSGSASAEVPFGPDLLFAAEDVPGLVLHVEICEDMWVPVPPSAEAALAGATVLANLSGSPITIGRAEDRELLCAVGVVAVPGGVRLRRGRRGRVDHRPRLGRPDDDLRERRPARRDRALSRGRRGTRSPTSTSTCCVQERLRMGTFDDNRRAHAERTDGFRTVSLPARPARRRPRAAARAWSGSRSCRPTRRGSSRTATRPTTSRSRACEQRLRAIGQPKVVIGVSGGLDSTHALIVAAQAMDRAGRPRSDILGVHPARVRHRRPAPRATPSG